MAKRIKRNVTKSIKKNVTKRNTKKRKIRHKKRRQTIRRIYRGGADAIKSDFELTEFLKDTSKMLRPGQKIIFQVATKNGYGFFNTYDTTQLRPFIGDSCFTVNGMIEDVAQNSDE